MRELPWRPFDILLVRSKDLWLGYSRLSDDAHCRSETENEIEPLAFPLISWPDRSKAKHGNAVISAMTSWNLSALSMPD